MRILLVNPNTSVGITDRLAAAARTVASPATTLVPLTAPRGMPYISGRAEAQIGGMIAIEMLAEHHEQADAAILAAFGDPGLFGARELFDIPVVGLAEAAMLTACMLGRRFAIVTFASTLASWYEDCIEMHGLGNRCSGVRALSGAFASVVDVADQKEAPLVELMTNTVAEVGADVLILGGAPLAGLADRIKTRVPVPLIDPVQAATKQAETLVALKPRKAQLGTFSRPPAKATVGLTSALAGQLGRTVREPRE
ncbi:MAG TPA: aspartate/glutamate racemase family protein [Hyphomicrobiaceae bacterium]|jgi:Asp/Glu/hydantoin racemase|nr:aspartate/glutamate racemase family protein [Hyphomicrobiaceae bacterium]